MINIKTNLKAPTAKIKEIIDVPKTILVNEFSEASAKKFREEMQEAGLSGQEVIPVIVDSFGGEVYAVLSMIDTIRGSRVPVATIVSGKAMSCGIILAACGTKGYRYATPNSTIMIHEVSGGDHGKTTDVAVTVEEMRRLNTKLMNTLDIQCGKKKGYFEGQLNKRKNVNWYLTADQAKKEGLCDFAKFPTINFEITSRLVFE